MRVSLLFPFRLTAWAALVAAIALPRCIPAFGADVIHFKDGMRTVCHGKAWEEKDEVHCEYDGGLLIYPKKDVSHIAKGSIAANTTETNTFQNLRPPASQPPTAGSSPPPAVGLGPFPGSTSGIMFYDPRRAKKYWSSATAHHESYREALSALSAEFSRSASWIEENMGESNDLREIRDILANRSKTSPYPAADIKDYPAAEGIEFYNPRRPKKYWTSQYAHHDTLDQAIEALGAEFGKPAAWIERHMGDDNDLEHIRRSLQEAPTADSDK
jgi:hypothetical protein